MKSRVEEMTRNLFACHVIPTLSILLFVQFHPSTQLSNFTDYSALIAFKSHIRSDPSGILSSNWSSSKSFCNWVGVSCTPSNYSIRRVTSLQLQGRGLQGTLAPQIANLSFLAVLDLSDNHFNGTMPSEFSLLHHLKVFNVSRNNFQGPIPPSISHCEELRELILSDNTFIGTIPQELGIDKCLVVCNLSQYGLYGRVSTSADVYSYGILLLETFARKKPTDDMFTGGSSLRRWVVDAFPDAVTKVVDDTLLMEISHNHRNGSSDEKEKENPAAIEQLLVPIIHVGLSCARESPEERSNMSDVVLKLKKIRMSLGA